MTNQPKKPETKNKPHDPPRHGPVTAENAPLAGQEDDGGESTLSSETREGNADNPSATQTGESTLDRD